MAEPLVPAAALTVVLQDGSTVLAQALLAEPEPTSPEWLCALTRRLVAADLSPRLLALGDARDPLAQRLAAAGWGLAAQDGDGIQGAGLGARHPALVVVGSRPKRAELALHCRAGRWLWAALRCLGWDELCVRAVSAYRPDGTPDPALERVAEHLADHPVPWLVLGRHAVGRVRAVVGRAPLVARSPGYARRWVAAAGPEGYGRELVTAGVPRGHWLDRPLPVAPWPPGGPSGLPAALTAVPTSVAHRRGRARKPLAPAPAPGSAAPVSPPAPPAPAPGPALPPPLGLMADGALALGLGDVLLRLRAARGDPEALDRLRARQAAGDEGAVPLHPRPADLRILLELAAVLRTDTGAQPDPAITDDQADDLARVTARFVVAERERADAAQVK